MAQWSWHQAGNLWVCGLNPGRHLQENFDPRLENIFYLLSIYLYKNGRKDVCLFVCWYVEGLMKFCTHRPTYPRKVLVQV